MYKAKDITEAVKRLNSCMEWVMKKHHIRVVPREDAPQTFKSLNETMQEANQYRGPKDPLNVVVWNGASATALFGNEGNYLFRAWHDYCHWILGIDFKTENEYRVMVQQQKDYEEYRLCQGQWDAIDVIALELLRLEIYGQRVVYDDSKEYLDNQKRFAVNCLHGQAALYIQEHDNQQRGKDARAVYLAQVDSLSVPSRHVDEVV